MSGNAAPGGLPNSKPAARLTRTQLQAAANAAAAAAAAAVQNAVLPQAAGGGAGAPDATALLVQLLQQQQLQAVALQAQQALAHANAELAAADALAQQRRAGAGAPPLFSGVRGGDELAINTWLDALESWFNVAHVDSGADEERIEIAAASMRGAAQQWWTATRANDTAAVAAGGASTISTWAGVVAQLRKAYLPQDPARWAMQQLRTLEHGANADVQAYTNRFLQLDMLLAGKRQELDRVCSYEQGLPESYRVKSAEKQHATLTAAVEAALALWNAKAVARTQSHSSGTRHGAAAARLSHTQTDEASDDEREKPPESDPSSSSAAASSSHSATSRLEQKMDALISAMQMQYGRGGGRGGRSRGGRSGQREGERSNSPGRGGARTAGVSDELARQRMQARVCIKCAEPGHYARDCPNALKTN